MGIYDGIGKVNDLLSGVTTLAASKKESLLKQGVNAALLFVVLAVFGCLDFATLTFHPEYVTTASYWGEVVTKVVAGVCSFNIGINFMLDTEIRKNAILTQNIERYNELIQKKQIDFEYFVTRVFNPKEKKKAYVSSINRKIHMLNRFSRRKDRLLWSSELPENQAKKEKNRYCKARKQLEDLKSEEFIAKNLDSLYVRYREVDPATFDLEIDGTQRTSGVKTTGSVGLGRAKASSSIVFGMVAFSMLSTAFGLALDKEKFDDQMEAFLHYLFKIVEDVFIVLWQTMQGMFRTRKIVTQQLTEPYAGRVQVLTEYLEWRLTEKKPDTLSYLELNKQEYIEVTQEEFEKMKKGE